MPSSLWFVVALIAAFVFVSTPVASQNGLPSETRDAMGEAVQIASGTNLLSGSLFTPPGPGPHPAFVALQGSGDASYLRSWMPEVFPFWKDITELLVERGYAVLLFDKPGVNESTGDWRRQSFDARAEEAITAVRYLASRSDIDPTRIGLAGHSQGGWIAQIAGARFPEEVGFLILFAGPAVSVRQQIQDDMESHWVCNGISGAGLAVRKIGVGLGLRALSLIAWVAKPGYLSRIINFDPRRHLSEIQQPTLAMFAGNDPLVPPEANRLRLERYFGTVQDDVRLVINVVSGADHFFRASPSCPAESRPTEWAPEFFESLEDPQYWQWLRGAVAAGS